MQKTLQSLKLFTIIITLTTSLDFFLEHNPLDPKNDYLYLFPKTSHTSIIYKIPKLQHRETFTLKICKKDTIEKNSISSKNCLSEIYGTQISLDYKTAIPLTKKSVYNLYQICAFGVALSEGEKSLLFLNSEKIRRRERLENSGLFFREPEEILELYENPVRKRYRSDFRENSESRCSLGFGRKEFFEESRFLEGVKMFGESGELKELVLEYDFESEDMGAEEFYNQSAPMNGEKLTTEELIKKRTDILDKMGKILIFEKKQVKKENFSITLKNSENKIILQNMRNETLDEPHKTDITLPKNTFYRFYPMFCYDHISPVETKDPNTLIQHNCSQLSENKLLLAHTKTGIFFVTKENAKKKIDFQINVLDFTYYHKETPNEKVIIDGIEENCDLIIDTKFSLIFYLCYQKSRIMKDQKMLKEFLPDLKFHIYEFERNSDSEKIDKRVLGNLPLIFQLLRLGISIGCLVGMIVVFSVGASWVAGLVLGICFLVFFVWFLSAKFCRDRGRVLAGFDLEKYLDEGHLEEVKQRIREASFGSFRALKGKNRVVLEMNYFEQVWTDFGSEDFFEEGLHGDVHVHLGNVSIIDAEVVKGKMVKGNSHLIEDRNGIDFNFEGVKGFSKSVNILV